MNRSTDQSSDVRSSTSCPDLNTLFLFLGEDLDPQEQREIAAHVKDGCSQCDESIRFLDTTCGVSLVPMEEPPADVMASLMSIPQRYSPVPNHLPEEMFADLVFDSAEENELVGVRRTAIAPDRRFTYRAGDWDIEFQIEPVGKQSLALTGVIQTQSGTDLPELRVILFHDDQELDRDECDEFGQFSLETSRTQSHRGLQLKLLAEDGRSIRICL